MSQLPLADLSDPSPSLFPLPTTLRYHPQLRRDNANEAREDFDSCLKSLEELSGLDESSIQVMKFLCYEFQVGCYPNCMHAVVPNILIASHVSVPIQDMHPTVMGLFHEHLNPLVEILCIRMDEIFGHAGVS